MTQFHSNEMINSILTEAFLQLSKILEESNANLGEGGILRIAFDTEHYKVHPKNRSFGFGVELPYMPKLIEAENKRIDRFKRIEELGNRLREVEDSDEKRELMKQIGELAGWEE